MNDLAREKLAKLVFIHGRAILEDARRCEEGLRESCPECRPEIAVLVEALRLGVVARLREQAGEAPTPALVGELARKIQAAMPVTDEAARWAVQTWAAVMGRGERASAPARRVVMATVVPQGEAPPPVYRSAPPRQRRRGVSAGRFFGLFLWSFIGGPLFALFLVILCWAVLPALFMLVGALIDLAYGGFSTESMDRTGEAITVIWQAYVSDDTKQAEALFKGPAAGTVTLWLWAVGSGISTILVLPILAWKSLWSGPARSVGSTIVLIPYLAMLGALGGGVVGAIVDGRTGAADGSVIGAMGMAGLTGILGLIAWISSLVKASRQ